MILSTILFAPIIGVLVLVFISNERPNLIKGIAASVTFISFVTSLYMLYSYDYTTGGFQFLERYEWASSLGISFHLGVDGISIPLILASSILVFTGVFVSWHIKDRPKEFFISLLVLASATIGVFTSLDLFFLYFFYEMAVIPMYLLIGIWGSHTKGYLESDREKRDKLDFFFNLGYNSKEYAAMKLTLFLSFGAVVALLGILLIYLYAGLGTFDIIEISSRATFSGKFQWIVFPLLLFGFGSIAPLWPLHSWSPCGHAAAPAAVSMLHAGVLMKLGSFSILRVAFDLLPYGTREWMPLVAILCLFNIVYGGLVALFQKDTKYVIGYSSSSHMGYLFLGLASLNVISITGAVLYMFAHALATGMLFAIAGFVYDQTHTRDIPSLGGLSKKMPFITGVFVVAAAASFGLPSTVNFIGELMILIGSWRVYPFQTIVAVLGITITMAYLMKMMKDVFFGEMNPHYVHVHDASPVIDRLPLIILMFGSIYFGIFPSQFINVIRAGVFPLVEKIQALSPLITNAGGNF